MSNRKLGEVITANLLNIIFCYYQILKIASKMENINAIHKKEIPEAGGIFLIN